jgi:RimJ/RimL family protein N-acetyltransferase
MTVRQATEMDIPQIVDMAGAFFFEMRAVELSFDEESAADTAMKLITSDDGSLIVAEMDGKLVGMAGAIAFSHYMSASNKVAQEMFWWVDKEHRGGIVAMRLLRAMEDWAKERGCSSLTMICLPIDSPAEEIYKRTGYRPLERSYIKEL